MTAPNPGTAPATVGNQPTETIKGLHGLLNDVRTMAHNLNGDIQGTILRIVDEAKAELDKLIHHGTPSTMTVSAPVTPQIAEPGSEAHAEGLKISAQAQQDAAQEVSATDEPQTEPNATSVMSEPATNATPATDESQMVESSAQPAQ
jgi:hypothetical protein